MAPFTRLIKFEADNGRSYFADLGADTPEPPAAGTVVKAFKSFDEMVGGKGEESVTLVKLLAPLPRDDLPIYCVGLNYKSHAAEANLKTAKIPPLWTKPAGALAHPGQDIIMNKFCADSLPDYEGELTFVTSKTCKDVSPEEARSYILGYTVGNDLSCRLFQMPDQAGGQYFYAKAFDGFAPVGPTLFSADHCSFFSSSSSSATGAKLTTRVNGHVRQEAGFEADMVFDPATILSYMSQGTTIPAYTAVMTGTPAGVGVFMTPKTFLGDGDVMEISVPGIGTLKNKIIFK